MAWWNAWWTASCLRGMLVLSCPRAFLIWGMWRERGLAAGAWSSAKGMGDELQRDRDVWDPRGNQEAFWCLWFWHMPPTVVGGVAPSLGAPYKHTHTAGVAWNRWLELEVMSPSRRVYRSWMKPWLHCRLSGFCCGRHWNPHFSCDYFCRCVCTGIYVNVNPRATLFIGKASRKCQSLLNFPFIYLNRSYIVYVSRSLIFAHVKLTAYNKVTIIVWLKWEPRFQNKKPKTKSTAIFSSYKKKSYFLFKWISHYLIRTCCSARDWGLFFSTC